MKTANLRRLRHDFRSVYRWVAAGEKVEILKKGKVIALLSPPVAAARRKKIVLPDFAARQQRIFGDQPPLPGNIVLEERESYE
jgi:antitoxin (DNA-binding transcriptional repressor) of toxin-antitoxin stability system